MGSLNSQQAPPDHDGVIRMVLSPDPPGPGVPWIKLEPDAVAIITRDYLADPGHDRRATWTITAADPPTTIEEDDADLARRFRAALTWVRDQSAMVPLTMGEPNTHRPALPGAHHHLRVGGRGRGLRHGHLRPDRRPGPGPTRAVPVVRLLEPVSVEPVPPHLQLRLRAGHHQRHPGAATSPTAPGRSSSPPGTRATPTGSPPPATTGAGSGSGGSCPTTRPISRRPRWLPSTSLA